MEQCPLDTAMQRLKEITETLENNECDLDMSMKLYEEGVRLLSFCSRTLNDCKQRIAELSAFENGAPDDEAL